MIFNFVERIFVYGLICVHASYAEFCRYNFVKKINDSVEFDCFVKEHHIKGLIWTKDNSTITKGEGDFSHLFYNTTTIYIPTIHREDEGLYSCFFLGQLIGRYCLRVEVPPEISIYVDSNHQQGVLWAKRGDIMNLKCVAVGAVPFVNITWSLKDIKYITFGPTQTTVQDDDGSFTTNSSLSFMVTKNVNFIECISVGQNTSSQAASINISSYVVPSIHIMLNGKNLTSPLRASTNTIYNFQCVAFGSKPTVKLGWKVDDTLQKERETFERPNEFNEYSYDSIINLTTNFSNARTSISCFIESPPLTELDLNATLDILTDRQTGGGVHFQQFDEWKILLLVVLLVPIVLGLTVLWLKFRGFIHKKGVCFKGSVKASEVQTSSNDEIEFELYSDSGLNYDTKADCHEKYQHKESYGKQSEVEVCRRNIIITSVLSGNGFVKYSIGHNIAETRKKSIICKSVKDEAQVKDVYHFLKMADESSLLRHHPNVVEFLAISKEEMPFYTYHEHVAGGSVRDYLLKNYQSSRISKSFVQDNRFEKHQEKFGLELRTIGLDVASGMEFLQTNQFCHPGLMAKKVLMNLEGCCKLYDFWPLEVSLQQTKRLLVKKNPPTAWLAPELIFLDQYHIKSDVWSFGVFLWELFSFGEVPYKSLSNTEIENSVRNSKHLSLPCSCPGAIINIMLSCWSKNTDKRPTFKAMYDELQSIRHGSSKPTTGSESTISSSSTNCKESDSANDRRHAYFVLNPDEEDYIEAK